MKSTSIKVIESIRLTSLVAVAFLSSAITVAMVGILLAAFNFGFIGGVDPVLTFLSSFGATTRFSQQASLGGNYTQIAKVDIQDSLGGKSSLSASVVFKSPVHASPETLAETTADPAVSESETESIDVGFDQSTSGFEQSASLPEGVPAMLRRKNNSIEIGNFHSVTMDGAADECLNIGYSMLSAAKANQDLLDVMVTNKQITIANICASNGKVVFSCRNGKISISPRRARPDDSCSRA